MSVKLKLYPSGEERSVDVSGVLTVGDILKMLGLDPSDYVVVKNGEVVTEDDVVSNGDVIEVYRVVSGG
ncbi:MAG: MoaD/ThiS family protein [Desulfurococcales archaeon]|nr:MoaD/ThiS family protein [Desulfurococcales archaeon]